MAAGGFGPPAGDGGCKTPPSPLPPGDPGGTHSQQMLLFRRCITQMLLDQRVRALAGLKKHTDTQVLLPQDKTQLLRDDIPSLDATSTTLARDPCSPTSQPNPQFSIVLPLAHDNVSAALRFTGFQHARTHGSEFRSYGEALRNPLDREGATSTHARSDGESSTGTQARCAQGNSRLFSFPVGRVSSSAVPILDSEGADSAGADSLSLAPKDAVTCCRAPALVVNEAMQQSADALHQLQYEDPLQYIDPNIQHLNTHQEVILASLGNPKLYMDCLLRRWQGCEYRKLPRQTRTALRFTTSHTQNTNKD